MMSPDNILPKQKPGAKDESVESSNGRKTAPLRPPDQQPLKCPRCDSPNTKFCYYNNYSLTQPRHFCKTCRRYWTKGGALRNVPIGGGCRKNKKISKSSSSRLSVDSKDYSSSGTSSEMGGTGLKFFNGLSPAMDFQLGGLSFPRPASIYNQFSSFGDILASSATACASNDPSGGSAAGSLMGFNYNPLSSVLKQQGDTSGGGFGTCAIQDHMGGGAAGGGGSMNVHTNLASSIESLSFINQDLHWKLQQQRLAMLFGSAGDNNQKEIESQSAPKALQPILFENLEISKPDQEVCVGVGNSRKDGGGCTGGATEWFFDNSYAPAVVTATPANSNSNGGNDNTTSNNWSGIQAWSTDLHQYSALP